MTRRGRIPKPWPRAQTGTWYVTLDGRQIPLGKTKREAHAEFARLMASRGQGVAGHGRIAVTDLIDLWLDDCERRLSPETVATYRTHARSFIEHAGSLQVRDLKPYHVGQWLDAKAISQSTRHIATTVVKLAVQWGEDQGYLDSNPIKKVRKPGITRRKAITAEEAEAIMANVSPRIRVALSVLLVTGVRPGELCSMTAERTTLGRRRATVRGKTGERTIPLSDAAIAILEPLVREHPTGPILWSARAALSVASLEHAVECARQGACEALGRSHDGCDHITPHCFRGLYSTEALRRGVDSALVSKLLGHSDPTILMKHYASPDEAMLRDAANRATRTGGSSEDSPPGLPG